MFVRVPMIMSATVPANLPALREVRTAEPQLRCRIRGVKRLVQLVKGLQYWLTRTEYGIPLGTLNGFESSQPAIAI